MGIFKESDIDRIFRMADFGIRNSHKDELRMRLFSGSEDELSEDELMAAAGGTKEQDQDITNVTGRDRR